MGWSSTAHHFFNLQKFITVKIQASQRPKRVGRVAHLTATISAMMLGAAQGVINKDALALMAQKNALLTNGYQAPIPRRMLNQRQIRKKKRQTQNF